jgi:hypothetical protein
MVARTMALRIGMGFALVLAALAAVASFGAARAQAPQASITLYKAVCPEGYTGTNYGADCYGTPGGGYTFTLTGPGFSGAETTAASGFAAFEGISANGTYTLIETLPPNIDDFAVSCSAGGQPFPFTYVAGGISLALTTADDLRCDWFNVPVCPATNDQASVTIRKADCPPEYTGTAVYEDCYANPGSGYTFTLSGPGGTAEATTGAAGVAFFEGITEPGAYTLTETPPAPVEAHAVFCTEDDAAFPFTYVQGGIAFTLGPNDDVKCDWFNVPADNQLASVTIYKTICPAGYTGTDYYADCYDTPGANISFALAGPAGPATATTGADGFAFFENIDAAGTYTITETFPASIDDFAVFCSEAGTAVDVTKVANGITLDLALDDDLRCDWFDIPEAGAAVPTSQPTTAAAATSTPAVSTLPRTGAGPTETGLFGGSLALALALAGITVVAVAILRTRVGRAGTTRR